MRRWRPSLRMAWRDLRRHRLRSLLTLVLVMLPVLVATAAALLTHNVRYDGEREAREQMGAADARVNITTFAAVTVKFGDAYLQTHPAQFTREGDGKRKPVKRPRSDVDLASLLPEGSRLIPSPRYGRQMLVTGGAVNLHILDAADPMSVGLFPGLEEGRAPQGDDEAAVHPGMAEALGMLDNDGQLRDDARLSFGDGSSRQVVGLLKPESWSGTETEAEVLIAASATPKGQPNSWLVDLPDLGHQDTRALVRNLADRGVTMFPRDVFYHPGAWGVPHRSAPIDPRALGIGALVILFGLIEVVLVVGSAFAVGARRQIRDLGLLAATGGSPADVRRALFAQGLVVGVLGSVLGVVAGVGAFFIGVPLYEDLRHTTVWTRDLDWSALVVIGMLGAVTGLVAALVPAWGIGRLTPVQALSGRFALSNREAHAHRGAFWLTGAGMLVLAVSGLWLSREFATTATGQSTLEPSPLPIALGGLGLLMLIVGVVWMAPYAVRRIAALGRLLPLTGRHAFRDAARHRFRTAAAGVALTVTTGALVLGTFALASAAAVQQGSDALPPHSVYVDIESTTRRPAADTVTDLTTTLEQILGPLHVHTLSIAFSRPGVRDVDVRLLFDQGSTGLWALDEETLRWLVAPEDIDAALATYRAGGVVSVRGFGPGDEARIRVGTGHRRDHEVWPALRVSARSPEVFPYAWISRAAAAAHDLDTRPIAFIAVANRQVTSEDLTALTVRGISAYSKDPLSAQTRRQTLGVLGLGGLVTALVAGIAVALAAAEGRSDMATLAAIGASPRRRRMLGAGHGLFLGLTGTALGLLIGLPAGLSLTQLDGLDGVQVPWLAAGATALLVPLVAALAAWVVTPTRLSLVRRGG